MAKLMEIIAERKRIEMMARRKPEMPSLLIRGLLSGCESISFIEMDGSVRLNIEALNLDLDAAAHLRDWLCEMLGPPSRETIAPEGKLE